MNTERMVVSPNELMKILGLGRSTIYEGLRTGAIPSVRVGRRFLISKRALEALLAGGGASHGRTPTGGPGQHTS